MDVGPTRILVVDDEAVVRDAYRHLFGDAEDCEVIAEASDGREAVARYEEVRPDVVLMDLKMPRMSGVEAMTEIGRRHPDACIIAVTSFASLDYVVPALRPKKPKVTFAAPTLREQEVLDHLAQGLSNKDIAAELCISEAAVKAHLRHLGDKFGVRSRTQILVFAYRHGLASPEPVH